MTEGRKDDQGKLDLTKLLALPEDMLRALVEVAEVEDFGAKKYGKENWRKLSNLPERYLAAAIRHVRSRITGAVADDESERHALAHAICCLMFVMAHDRGQS